MQRPEQETYKNYCPFSDADIDFGLLLRCPNLSQLSQNIRALSLEYHA